MSDWDGRPRLRDGVASFKTYDITNWLMAMTGNTPVITRFDKSDDGWVVVFPGEEELRTYMEYLQKKTGSKIQYRIVQIKETMPFARSIWDAGLRIMLNPKLVNPETDHLRWQELVPDERLNTFIEENR